MSQRIFITGGSSEIGRAIARRNISAGNEVIYSASSQASLEATAEIWRAEGLTGQGVVFDLDGDAPLGDELKLHFDRGVDGLVLNAASAVKELKLFHEIDLADARGYFEKNVMGNLKLIQAALPGMMERRLGRLVLISSVTVAMGSSRYSVYSLSKGALEALFLNLAVDYGHYNILSNVVRPGTIQTERTRRFWSRPKYVERITGIIPQRTMGTPGQVAEALDPLLSKTSYINGATIAVSGGLPLVRSERL